MLLNISGIYIYLSGRLRRGFYHPLFLAISLLANSANAQQKDTLKIKTGIDTLNNAANLENQIDMIDIFSELFGKERTVTPDSVLKKPGKVYVSFLPGAGYVLQTGFTAATSFNLSFYTSKATSANISSIIVNANYSQYHQVLVPLEANIWTKYNRYNFSCDWRYYKYPSYTYGLGGFSSIDNAVLLDYSYIRVYQTALRKITGDLYAGIGYNLDYHWGINISDSGVSKAREFINYGYKPIETSSGATLNLLYDNRRNSINAERGFYANLKYRYNVTELGSDQNWSSMLLEFKKYLKYPRKSRNVLAFWNFYWLTLNGKAPYLDLPSTGWDTYSNSGRGYIQGRLKGNNFIYLETEYRMVLTRNGLFGCVVFANAEGVSNVNSNKIDNILPAVGAGLRLKLNKYSRTNASLDYGIGANGSKGFFFNLGEVF